MILTLSDPLLHLRTIRSADDELLFRIYASTRMEELAQVTRWTADQKETFLRSQFIAQHRHYQANYKGAHFWVITYGSALIGRLYLHTHYEDGSMRIIDISLLPEWRNKSLGKKILLGVLEYATRMSRSVTIHVESFNPAMKLYKRLGFELLSQTNGVYHLLEWKSGAQAYAPKDMYNQSTTNGSCTSIFNGR